MLEDFRPSLCRCASCYPLLAHHRGLLDEEETYEPPLSSTDSEAGAGSLGSGARSLLERGEAALSNVDRVRAIEGVMVYNHLKSKVKDFLKPFAESGTPVGAEDIKRYFESLRGDAEAIRTAGMKDGDGDGGEGGDNRKEQSGEFCFAWS
jgi:E3 ubiquitin-protein ligase UBR7